MWNIVFILLNFRPFAEHGPAEGMAGRAQKQANLVGIIAVTAKKKIVKKAPAKAKAKAEAGAKGKTAPAKSQKASAKTAAKPARPGLATAAAILGRPVVTQRQVPAKIKPEWVKYYQILLDLRERLLNQMSGLAKESAEELPGYSLHMADSGTDNFDRDFALSLLSADQDSVYEIEEALKRIERNTYGICEMTGKPIPRARLDAIPWTRFTVEAQAQLERDGALRQRRLGSLGSVDASAVVEVEEAETEEEERPAKERE